MAARLLATRFGRHLRDARERCGMTQEELGDRAGISASQVYRLEVGDREPRLSTVVRLAQALEMDGSDLIRGI
jgi:predicted transcriptional regulator